MIIWSTYPWGRPASYNYSGAFVTDPGAFWSYIARRQRLGCELFSLFLYALVQVCFTTYYLTKKYYSDIYNSLRVLLVPTLVEKRESWPVHFIASFHTHPALLSLLRVQKRAKQSYTDQNDIGRRQELSDIPECYDKPAHLPCPGTRCYNAESNAAEKTFETIEDAGCRSPSNATDGASFLR